VEVTISSLKATEVMSSRSEERVAELALERLDLVKQVRHLTERYEHYKGLWDEQKLAILRLRAENKRLKGELERLSDGVRR
jgi:hypothetical protein